MESIIKAMKELMMYVLLGVFLGGVLLVFFKILTLVSY